MYVFRLVVERGGLVVLLLLLAALLLPSLTMDTLFVVVPRIKSDMYGCCEDDHIICNDFHKQNSRSLLLFDEKRYPRRKSPRDLSSSSYIAQERSERGLLVVEMRFVRRR